MAITALVVDDEEDILYAIADALEKEGMVAHKALNGRQALEILKMRAKNIDVLITDIRMPDINGVELLLMAKDINPDIKVIVITAYGSEDLKREVFSKGAIAYLEKPFDISDLIKKVEELSQQKKAPEWTLTELLQLITIEGKSAIVEVNTPDGKGRIFIVNGEIHNAEFGGLKGKQAFMKLISYDKSKFNILWQTPRVERMIYKPLYLLLLEAIVGSDKEAEILKKKEQEEKVVEQEKKEEEEEKSPLDLALEQVSRLFQDVEPEEEFAEEAIEKEPVAEEEHIFPEELIAPEAPVEQPAPQKSLQQVLEAILDEFVKAVKDADLVAVVDNTGEIISFIASDEYRSMATLTVHQLITGYKLLLEQLAKANVSTPYELLISTTESYILLRDLKGRGYLVGVLSEGRASSLGFFKLKMQELSPRVEEVMA